MPDRTANNLATDSDLAKIDAGLPQRLHALDAVRGLAAAIVLNHHCLTIIPAYSDYFYSDWTMEARSVTEYILFYTPARIFWSGYEAVTLFYVLSGLVLALPWIEGHPPQYRAFLVKRISRIYLPYVAIISIAAVAVYFLQPIFYISGGSNWINTETWSAPVTIENLVQHALMLGQTNFRLNGAVHSLVWEMRVSLLFPLLMIPMISWKWRASLILILGCFLIVAAIHVLLRSVPEASLTGTILWELQHTAYYTIFFVIGASMALDLDRFRRFFETTSKYHSGEFVMCAGLLMVQTHWSQTHAFHNIGVATGSVFVISAALAPGRIERFLLAPPLQFLGRISYSVYLVQVPILAAVTFFLQNVLPLWSMIIIVYPLVLTSGWAFHVLIAEPCARLGKRITRLQQQNPQRPISIKQIASSRVQS
ncbi:acyltransferase [Methylobacterium sp. WL6]|uniref:acyltransferase family protein n=1 Tax=Methylobacterium sp. WL6 TaxID=2603901 RepID=UPI0011C7CFB2|nr:acyltransferase [Methylobacterium sp. WL6]TXN73603.1 acyltransferase [Methylobacterium sp. WL6]